MKASDVAPRVGAWIETVYNQRTASDAKSHPEWVRGLKQIAVIHKQDYPVAPRVGAWIETIYALYTHH